MKQPQYGGCESLPNNINALFAFVSAILEIFKMDINKVSNLHCHLKNKYGEESVKPLQNWENLVMKMVAF